MNVKAQLSFLVFAAALAAGAATSISNVVVNQRWPWSEKVDVDFILSGVEIVIYTAAVLYAFIMIRDIPFPGNLKAVRQFVDHADQALKEVSAPGEPMVDGIDDFLVG